MADHHLPPGAYVSAHSFIPFPGYQSLPMGAYQPLPGQVPHQLHHHPQQLPQPQPQQQQGGEESEETDSEGGGSKNPANPNYKCKPRRKATQKPVGSDQKRQAFSKRKRGIVLKAYQLYKLTDAKVFMFMVNDKGSSWAYASPSFGSSLRPDHLKHMRELADLPHTPKHVTEVMAHPKLDETDRHADNRHLYLTSVSVQDNLHLVSGSVPASLPYLPPPLPPPRAQPGPSHMHDGMLPHLGHLGQPHMHHHIQPHLPEQFLGHPQQHIAHPQMQPPQMHMHMQQHVPHQLYQPLPHQQAQQQTPSQQQQQPLQPQPQQQGHNCNPQAQAAPLVGVPVANANSSGFSSDKKPGEEQHHQNPGPSPVLSPKASEPAKEGSPKKVTDANEPQQQGLGGKDAGSDDAVMITAASANLGCLKQDAEAEGVQSKPVNFQDQSLSPPHHEQQQSRLPPQQQQQPQQQSMSSMYAGRIIADPAGNLYRVVKDQLVPLLPHDLEHGNLGSGGASGGSQSPGLATLAAAAAAAVNPAASANPPPGSVGNGSGLGAGGGPEGTPTTLPQMHGQHPNPGGMYGGPAGFPSQPQYLMLPQHVGVGYGSLPFQAVSQPLYMDSMGGQGLGGMPFASSYVSSQPMLSMPMSFSGGSQQAPMGYSMISQPMSSSFPAMPQPISQPLSSLPTGGTAVHAP